MAACSSRRLRVEPVVGSSRKTTAGGSWKASASASHAAGPPPKAGIHRRASAFSPGRSAQSKSATRPSVLIRLTKHPPPPRARVILESPPAGSSGGATPTYPRLPARLAAGIEDLQTWISPESETHARARRALHGGGLARAVRAETARKSRPARWPSSRRARPARRR